MRPAGEAVLLIRLEHRVPARRQDPEHEQRCDHGRPAEDRQMSPARTRDEEHPGERSRIDHCGSEVRLEEDEQNRHGRKTDRRDHGPAVADPLRTIGEQAG